MWLHDICKEWQQTTVRLVRGRIRVWWTFSVWLYFNPPSTATCTAQPYVPLVAWGAIYIFSGEKPWLGLFPFFFFSFNDFSSSSRKSLYFLPCFSRCIVFKYACLYTIIFCSVSHTHDPENLNCFCNICLSSKYLLSTHFMISTVLGTGDTVINKTQ